MSLGGMACGEWDADAGKVFGSSTNPSTSARSGSSGSSGQFSSAAGRLHCRPGHPATRRERQAHTLCPSGHGSSFRRANGICVIRLQVAASSSHVDSVSRTGCCVPNRPSLRQSKIPGENNITFARKPLMLVNRYQLPQIPMSPTNCSRWPDPSIQAQAATAAACLKCHQSKL